MKQYRKFFCSFGDSRLKRSLKRIKKQAEKMTMYDGISVCTETDLDSSFLKRFERNLIIGSRGFGYWCWKPQIILQSLLKMEEGDVLQYSDTGCHLNRQGRKRLSEYFDLTKQSKSGILLFRLSDLHDFGDGKGPSEILEYRFTKSDLFKHFDVLECADITHTRQFAASTIFIRKEEETVSFIKSWISVFSKKFSLIDDTSSLTPNFEGFIDHRHDQSILSVLAKLRGVEELSSKEIFTDQDWSSLKEYPIWERRDRDYGLLYRLRHTLSALYNIISNANNK